MLKRIYDKQKIKEYTILDTGISNVSSYKIKSKSESNYVHITCAAVICRYDEVPVMIDGIHAA